MHWLSSVDYTGLARIELSRTLYFSKLFIELKSSPVIVPQRSVFHNHKTLKKCTCNALIPQGQPACRAWNMTKDFKGIYSWRGVRWLMMYVCVFCFAVWTASLNLNLDFRRDASNCGFILPALSAVYRLDCSRKMENTVLQDSLWQLTEKG